MGLNHDKLKQRRAGNRAGTGWRPREGQNKIRILPPHSKYIGNWEEMGDLAIAFKIHFFKIEGRPTEVSRCLEELTPKQRCPACEMWRTWRKSEDVALKEMAKQIAPADQYLFNVLDIGNLSAGVQAWSANYTCWDKILEVAANPSWGNVVDPADGINFDINMTPGTRSRTGYNQYGVTPEPQRTTVMQILEGIPDWEQVLDSLVDQISAAKEAAEVVGLLEEIGFPAAPGKKGPAAASAGVSPAPVATATPRAVAGVQPAAAPAVRPAVRAVAGVGPATLPAAQAPAQVRAVRPSAAPAPQPVGDDGDEMPEPESEPAAPTPRGGGTQQAAGPAVHYDPGPEFEELVPAWERPDGAPRCFGGYAPEVHRCQPCPLMADCQLKLLGIG